MPDKNQIERKLAESDLRAIEKESIEVFRELLRFDTTNPPGNEMPAIRFAESVLSRDEIECEVFEIEQNRGNLVCRLVSSGAEPPLMLSAHVDVVPANPAKWKHPPFEATIDDGWIYARGAIDMKNMACYGITILRILKRLGLPLKRDVILCLVSDEEAGCHNGSEYMVKEHAEKVRADIVFNEVGGFTLWYDDVKFYPVQIAEKGICWLRLKATGEPGHGSIPVRDSALLQAARAAEKLAATKLPMHTTEPAKLMTEGLASAFGFPKASVMRALTSEGIGRWLRDALVRDPKKNAQMQALYHNTANPTIFNSGVKINVIPDSAILEIDGRTLPGVQLDEFLSEVKSVVGNGFEFEVIDFQPASTTEGWEPILVEIQKTIDKYDPGGKVIPSLCPGFTDSRWYATLGARCVGFSPVKLGPETDFGALFHGHNERIPVDGYIFGLHALADVVCKYAIAE
ncbi:MAG: M20/M25/M40 family metallo-hydrolase [Planctomycetes bacterium]|nr:M20/M25/M40 family metallo-hydrolase [Planctomycetota bacterium]